VDENFEPLQKLEKRCDGCCDIPRRKRSCILCPPSACEELERLRTLPPSYSFRRHELEEMFAPWAAVFAGGSPEPNCWAAEREPLLAWNTSTKRLSAEAGTRCDPADLCDPEIDGVGLTIGLAPALFGGGQSGIAVDLAILDGVAATSELWRRDSDGMLLDEQPFQGRGTVLGTYGLRLEEWSEFQSLGFMWSIGTVWPLADPADARAGELDAILGVRLGTEHLTNEAGSSTQPQYGLVLGLGYGPLLSELSVERGHLLDAAGEVENILEYRFGIRFDFPATWLVRLFR
jgi:hypothetical protein